MRGCRGFFLFFATLLAVLGTLLAVSESSRVDLVSVSLPLRLSVDNGLGVLTCNDTWAVINWPIADVVTCTFFPFLALAGGIGEGDWKGTELFGF